MGNNVNFKSDLPQATSTPLRSGATVVDGTHTSEQADNMPLLKSPTWMRNIALAALLLGAAACEIDKTVDPIEQVEIKYKEYSVVPKSGEVYFTLPNGHKVTADDLVSFNVKENLTSGDKTIRLVFEGTKLKKTLNNVLNSMKLVYPNGRYGMYISFSKLGVNGKTTDLTSPIEFVEKYDKQLTAIGIDQLVDGQEYSFEDLMKLGGNVGKDSGVNIISREEKLIGNIGGGVESSVFSGYIAPTKIIFDI